MSKRLKLAAPEEGSRKGPVSAPEKRMISLRASITTYAGENGCNARRARLSIASSAKGSCIAFRSSVLTGRVDGI
jgi:hypothetical protein